MRIVIKVPAHEGDRNTFSSFTASVEKMLAEHPAPVAANFTPLPLVKGNAASVMTCRECYGTGAIINEQGKPDFCPSCGGGKQVVNTTPVKVGKRMIATHYLLLLSTLPGIRITADTGKSLHPLRFAFDIAGEGLLMPMNPSTGEQQPDSTTDAR